MATTTRKSWFEMMIEEEEEEKKAVQNEDKLMKIKIKQEPVEKNENLKLDLENPGSCTTETEPNIKQNVKLDENCDEKYTSCRVKVKQEVETNCGSKEESNENLIVSIGSSSDIQVENRELKKPNIENDIKVKSEKLCAEEDKEAGVNSHSCEYVTKSTNADDIKTLNSENISSVDEEKLCENNKVFVPQGTGENSKEHSKDIHMSTPEKIRKGRKRHRTFPNKNEHRYS